MGEASQRHFSQGKEFGFIFYFKNNFKAEKWPRTDHVNLGRMSDKFCPGSVHHKLSRGALLLAIFDVCLSDLHFP